MKKLELLTIAFIALMLAAFPLSAQDSDSEREIITLPISIYLVVDDLDNPDEKFASQRTEDELREILAGINDIWEPAGIVFELEFIGSIEVPEDDLSGIIAGNFNPFFNSARTGNIDIPELTAINGFYAREIGGPNGISFAASHVFFVTDTPSVHDRRVSSHEIGHILGLHHVRSDNEHLMSSGVNGMMLDEEEIIVARYFAQGILDGVR